MFVTYGTIASKLWRRRTIGETPQADSQRETERRLRVRSILSILWKRKELLAFRGSKTVVKDKGSPADRRTDQRLVALSRT